MTRLLKGNKWWLSPSPNAENLTTGACWRSAYSSAESPLQQQKKGTHTFQAPADTLALYISPQRIRHTLHTLKRCLLFDNSGVTTVRYEPSLPPLFHRGALSPCGTHHFHYLLFLHAKTNISAWSLIFEGRRLPPVLVAEVCMCLIFFWLALLGNRLGVAWPWVYRNNGRQLTGT